MGKLEGKVAVITGGTSGIGLATAKRFVAEGAFVFLTGRREAELDAATRAIGAGVRGVRGDVSSLADLDHLYEVVRREKGKLDVVFANAGGGTLAPLGAISEAHFDQTFAVNVKGMLFTVQKALPLLADGGSIVLTGSTAGVKGTPTFSVYSATKAAVRNFARSWALDLKDRGVRVNVVSPGPVDTQGLGDLFPREQARDILAGLAGQIPLGRLGAPDEIAKAVVFLASSESSFVNGAELFVDGGLAQI